MLVIVTGCVTNTESHIADVEIAPGVALILPDRPPFGLDANVNQLGEAVYHDKVVTFQAAISSSAEIMTVVMTLPSGPRIMSFEWSDKTLKTKIEPMAPKGLSAEHMVADMMMMYAEPEILKAAIHGAEVRVQPDGSRAIFKDGREIIEVTRPAGSTHDLWNGRATLRNIAFGYVLSIQSQSTVASLAD